MPEVTKEESEFIIASRPLIKYLAENHHPHVTAIITGNSVQLVEGMEGQTINDYLVD